AAANAAFNARRTPIFGIQTQISVDDRAVMARARKERDGFVSTTLKSIENLPAGVCIRQRAHFVGETRLALDDGSAVTAKTIVIATGGRPSIPTPSSCSRQRIPDPSRRQGRDRRAGRAGAPFVDRRLFG